MQPDTPGPSGRALVFSIAFNGYQWVYRRNIRSHRAYAQRHGFDYVLVQRPAVTSLLMECCWVKLPLILSAFEAGYEWVFFIDADAEIRPASPDFRSLAAPGKSLYMAHGFSGRVNSGVIIACNRADVRDLLVSVVSSFARPLPAEDEVGWGENGHVIHAAKHAPFLEVIPPAWNNNHSPGLADHVRHYSAGPLRSLYQMDRLSRLIPAISRLAQRVANRTGAYRYSHDRFPDRLMQLHRACVRSHAQAFRPLRKTDVFRAGGAAYDVR